jgi:hypothetical protein
VAELAAGFFYLSDLRELARRIFSVRLRFERGGNLTHVDKRITVRNTDVDFFALIDQAARRGAERRSKGAVRKYRLCAYWAGRAASRQQRNPLSREQLELAAIACVGTAPASSTESGHG